VLKLIGRENLVKVPISRRIVALAIPITVALATALLAGCQPAPPAVPPPPGAIGISANPSSGKDDIADPNVSWIMPSKVEIGNLYPNATGEFELTIYNGKDTTATYAIDAMLPDFVTDGYQAIPKDYLSWVTFDDARPVIQPKKQRVLIVDITMPAGVVYSQKKVELWVVVRDVTQAGSIQTQLASRVLIDTR
jgi:hypothetical protein